MFLQIHIFVNTIERMKPWAPCVRYNEYFASDILPIFAYYVYCPAFCIFEFRKIYEHPQSIYNTS